jgi:crotonobetainyl-CoA:carnitine CoA-transferase CaiB-like acyl-CoA transferase
MLVHDIGTGTHAALGALAALYERIRTGRGQEVTTTMVRASVLLQSGEFTSFAGRRPALRGSLQHLGESALHRLYECSDGWIAVAVTTESEAERALVALGVDLKSEGVENLPDGGGSLLRLGTHSELATEIERVLRGHTRHSAVDLLRSVDVAAVGCLEPYGEFTDEVFEANDVFIRFDDPQLGAVTLVRSFATWDGWRDETTGTYRLPGTDTAAVLGELGYQADRIQELAAAGAIVVRSD